MDASEQQWLDVRRLTAHPALHSIQHRRARCYQECHTSYGRKTSFVGLVSVHLLLLRPDSCHCSYPLTFTPSGSGSFTGTLELLLQPTGEKLQYTLSGKASEPLAEGHLLVECQVRRRRSACSHACIHACWCGNCFLRQRQPDQYTRLELVSVQVAGHLLLPTLLSPSIQEWGQS